MHTRPLTPRGRSGGRQPSGVRVAGGGVGGVGGNPLGNQNVKRSEGIGQPCTCKHTAYRSLTWALTHTPANPKCPTVHGATPAGHPPPALGTGTLAPRPPAHALRKLLWGGRRTGPVGHS